MTDTFREALHRVLQLLQDLIPYTRADVAEYDFENGEIHLLASTDAKPFPLSHEMKLPLSFSHHPFTKDWQKIKYIPDLHKAPELSPIQRILRTKGIRATAVASLFYGDRLLGSMNVGSDQPHSFTARHLQLLQEISYLLSLRMQQEQVDNQKQSYTLNLEALVELRTSELQEMVEKLAESNRFKNEFMAAISHELRTPLTIVMGKAETLQEEIYGPLNPKQQQGLQVIFESGQQLLTLINNLLDVSHMEREQVSLHITEVDAVEVCREVLADMRRRARAEEIQLLTELPRVPLKLMADRDRFQQILYNLLDNAVKFTPGGGKVGLEVRTDEEKDLLHFVVWDTGIGISPEKIDFIFMLFTQVDGRLSRRYGGSGLGLPLAYRLTQLHDGNMSVTSEVGKGSRFTVTLPTAFTSIETNS